MPLHQLLWFSILGLFPVSVPGGLTYLDSSYLGISIWIYGSAPRGRKLLGKQSKYLLIALEVSSASFSGNGFTVHQRVR